MASGQDQISHSEETQPYTFDIDNAQTNILNDYYIIDGPEKQKEDVDSASISTSVKGRSHSNVATERENYNKSRQQKTTNVSQSKENDKLSSYQHSGNPPPPTKPLVTCPPVNCKEKIIICLDLSEEMKTTVFRSRAGDKFSGLELAKRALKMFVMHKSQMNAAHEFAFMIFTSEPTMIQDFTSRPQNLLSTLEDTEMIPQSCGPLNVSKLFETIQKNVELPSVPQNIRVVSPPFIVRLLLVFGRSQSVPIEQGKQAQKILEASPYFFTDVLYLHEPPSDDNKCEEIFNQLCELDHSGLSYILEASKYTPILSNGAKLLAHPLQRPLQGQAAYKIGSLPVAQKIEERCI